MRGEIKDEPHENDAKTLMETPDLQHEQRGSQSFKPASNTVQNIDRVGINSYVNWLESRMIQKNKTSHTIDKKRDVYVRKKKKRSLSRNVYMNEIEM
jgi:hypothetical protein